MSNISYLNCKTTLPIPVDKVLDGAQGKLKEVIVIGWDENDDIYISTSEAKISEINLLLDVAKANLLEAL